ncbi:MAG: tetratricopeptide repeat protein [Planctomycetes bacterium]|nr:tetratricopeptide repeat protein [Planctomycetota bacterium]
MVVSFAGLALAGLMSFSPAVSSAALPAGEKDSLGAQAQLEIAKQDRRKANKTSGEEKRAILEGTIAQYQKVLELYGEDGPACAEASFRIGEIERSLGDAPGARAAFETTLRYGKDAPLFAARALNELGHLARRSGDAAAAIAAYERVLAEFPVEEAEAVKSLTWIGKVEAGRGNAEKARSAWLSIADRYPALPVQAVRAADLAALDALEGGDTDTAQEIVNRTRARFSADNKDQPWWSPEVEEALGKMKAPARLAAPEPAEPEPAEED